MALDVNPRSESALRATSSVAATHMGGSTRTLSFNRDMIAKAGPAELAGLASSFLVVAPCSTADLEVGYVRVGMVEWTRGSSSHDLL